MAGKGDVRATQAGEFRDFVTAELQQGQRLDNRFNLLRRLGKGGMSEVWLAQDSELDEQVALKVLHPWLARNSGFVDLLRNEYASARRLIHPAIVRSFDLHSAEGLHFISMEAVQGGDFSRFTGTSYRHFLPRLLPVIDALHYAHQQGVVHRDLKLSNILCDKAGHAQLADFGIAALASSGIEVKDDGDSGGSPYSRSPQQLDGQPASAADDLYALGVLLYELIDGHPPFYPDISDEKILTEVPAAPQGEAPEALVSLTMALLAKAPEDRPESMAEVRSRLRAILSADANATLPPEVAMAGVAPGVSHFETIEPETFRGHATPVGQRQQPARVVNRSVVLVAAWVAFGALMLIAGAVFFYLPDTVEPALPVVADTSTQPTQAGAGVDAPARPPPTGLTPWDTAQLARDREAAEAILEKLLALQFELEEKGVRVWADGQFDAARAKAREGDQAYSLRDYAGATDKFTESYTLLEALDARAETVLESTLAEAWEAYEQGDTLLASQRFELAARIDEGNAEARDGLARTAKLPDVLANMQAGAASERAGNAAAALESYSAAVAIDPDYSPASEAVARMRESVGSRQLNDAMSQGFVALEQKRYRDARRAFTRALELSPGSAAARDALAQAELEIRLGELAALQSAAAAAAEAEQWDTALEKFKAVLALDSTVVFAREGSRQAAERAALDKQLTRFIDEPERLSQDSVFSAAQKALSQAEALADKGPRLNGQMQQLARLLAVARIPVPVRLESDNITEVTILRVDRLGRFESRELKLRPGTYTAVGIRDGYRDVRKEFTLAPGDGSRVVRVQCEERI